MKPRRRFPAAFMAVRNLERNRLRSALAGLTIVIGVLAIASLGIFGTTLHLSAKRSIGDVGNVVVVSPAGQQEAIEPRTVERIRRTAPPDATVAPLKQQFVTVHRRGRRMQVIAYSTGNPKRVFTAAEGRVPVSLRNGVLVGSKLAAELGVGPGNRVRIGDRSYRVRAVLASRSGASPLSTARAVVLPARSFRTDSYDRVIVVSEDSQQANATAAAIRETVNSRKKRVQVFEYGTITRQLGAFFGVLNVFLFGVGSISLVVAGVSIFNVMLMSAIEREGEIGVFRAIGYHKRTVVRILVTEAAVLGFGGAVVGVVLSVGVGVLINWALLGDPGAVFHPWNLRQVVLAFGVALVTSVASGAYPAWRAANKHPVDALRD